MLRSEDTQPSEEELSDDAKEKQQSEVAVRGAGNAPHEILLLDRLPVSLTIADGTVFISYESHTKYR
jgi:hypothetical protein